MCTHPFGERPAADEGEDGSEGHDEDADDEVGTGQRHYEQVAGRLQRRGAPDLNRMLKVR